MNGRAGPQRASPDDADRRAEVRAGRYKLRGPPHAADMRRQGAGRDETDPPLNIYPQIATIDISGTSGVSEGGALTALDSANKEHRVRCRGRDSPERT